MRWRAWLAVVVLAPIFVLALGTQLAALVGLVGVAQAAAAAQDRDLAMMQSAGTTLDRSAAILSAAWNSPVARALDLNPMTFGTVGDVGDLTEVLSSSADALTPLAEAAALVVGTDGASPILSGSTFDTTRVGELADPVDQIATALADTRSAVGQLRRSGPLGWLLRPVVDSLETDLADWNELAVAARSAVPDLPDALGEQSPRRYLICALNDAELFGSGGAPLYAIVVKADRGTLSLELAGQLATKLAPGNRPIAWDHVGQLPWYEDGHKYPFVNSNFHPDFRTASQDMSRAWEAVGYPAVDGVITIDVNALAAILTEVGPVTSTGYGTLTAENLVTTVLVDAYRETDSIEGHALRHSWNDALVSALVVKLTRPTNLLPTVRAVFESIPPRHIQLAFESAGLQGAAETLAATGRLSEGPGDLIGAFTQNSPNKTSVFHQRTIEQDVALTADGGATVTRTVRFTNAIPDNAQGDRSTWLGYSALRARFRVAHRLPLTAQEPALTTSDPLVFGGSARGGPYPDQRGGAVLWTGHEIPAGGTAEDSITYRLPAGTFDPGTYQVWADPQALTIPSTLVVRVRPTDGQPSATPPTGWTWVDGSYQWSGDLDRPLHLLVQ